MLSPAYSTCWNDIPIVSK
ncbi:DUF4113 domain-containing protein [Enterobacter bugandensis]|nr:DUF4113 domain-containing protein [Enterobacter bugandensis]MCM7319125.1 DUF4113 domain-containing protein [Enterobacter bugandensis]MCM7354548.1 DUF4113 domain-containing protein [Enterobacter bugandensis]